MYSKIMISGILQVKTGLHIGGSSQFSAIGSVDSPVIRDVETNLPMIPGSSIKGKMRTLLAKQYNQTIATDPNGDRIELLKLFGSSKFNKENKENRENKENKMIRGRLQFYDLFMSNRDEMKERGILSPTEVKFENTINRLTAVANPRQIERVIKGSEFAFRLCYTAEKSQDEESVDIKKDMKYICDGLKLLKYDYLGGNGSRGYGQIDFKELKLEVVFGELEENIKQECEDMLKEV